MPLTLKGTFKLSLQYMTIAKTEGDAMCYILVLHCLDSIISVVIINQCECGNAGVGGDTSEKIQLF